MSDVLDYEIVEDQDSETEDIASEAQAPTPQFDVSELPDVHLSAELRKEIELYIGSKITEMRSERQLLEEEWDDIEVLYEQVELSAIEEVDFPFENSAHLVIQIIAMYTETVWAKLYNTINAPADPFSTEPLREEFVTVYKALKRFLTWSCKHEIKLKKITNTLFMDLVKLGTCISKTVYLRKDSYNWVWDPVSRKYNKVMVRVKDCPHIIRAPLADVLFPIDTSELEDVEIIAHRNALTYAEVKRRLVEGIFVLEEEDGVEAAVNLKAWVSNKLSPSEQTRNISLGTDPRANNKLEFYELWFEYALPGKDGDDRGDKDDDRDMDSRGLPVKLVAWFNTDTQKLFRIQHNWYPLQMHPFDACAYIPRTDRVHGIGVGRMAMPTQKEITAMHNQRLDNATIANANITLIKDDSLLPLNFRLTPGGSYRVSDPNEIEIKPLGQKYDSTINEEQHTLQMLERRIGIQDFTPEQKVQTSTQAIVNMQELTRKFDAVVGNVRLYLESVITKVILLYQQHYPDGKAVMLLGQDGQYVQQLFQLPANLITYGIAVSVTATTSATSKELDRQAKLSIFNLITQYYGQLTQYVLQANNPQMPPMVQQTLLRIVDALGSLVGDILEDFDIAERDELIIQLGNAVGQPAQPGAGPAQPTQPGMAAGPEPAAAQNGAGAAQIPRLADIQRLLANQIGAGA